MKRKVVWLVVSCLMTVTLVLVSCGPAVTEEEEEEVVTEEEEEVVGEEEEEEEGPEMVLNAAGKLVEKPKYGGVFTYSVPNPARFDDILMHVYWAAPLFFTNEELLSGDWAKGPAGTGEASWLYTLYPGAAVQAGCLAESWEVIDDKTFVFNIRKGVRWHDKPPTNGRELTADDVVFSLIRKWTTETSYHYAAYPWKDNFEELDGGPWIEATDKYTVVIKCLSGRGGLIWEMATDHTRIFPRDALEMYGNMAEWQNSIGTGPFMLVDFVAASSLTYERNPNYWRKDPLHPENTLPYIDGIQQLVIPDASTLIAAMRTGKIDRLPLAWEDAADIMRTNPDLPYVKYLPSGVNVLNWRVDDTEIPYYDIRVRQALRMATNYQDMVDSVYGGEAEILTWPCMDIPEFSDVYIQLEELPESIREQFEYHPDKARQLLAEAGYPDGFQTEVVCYSAQVDTLSIIKAYWAEIGVDLEILVKDYAVYTSMGVNKTYEHIYVWGRNTTLPFRFVEYRPGSPLNRSNVNDPVIEEAYTEITAAYFNEPLRRQMMKEIIPYVLEQAYELFLPVGYAYTFWQPWVKGYHGEHEMGYMQYDFPIYLWLDQDLKEEMTGKR